MRGKEHCGHLAVVISMVYGKERKRWMLRNNFFVYPKELFMVKVKTFSSSLKIFQVHNELMSLDKEVNEFLETNKIKKVVSVSDSTTCIDGGTMGVIRSEEHTSELQSQSNLV